MVFRSLLSTLVFIVVFIEHQAFSQSIEIEADAITELVNEWDFAHNARSESTFEAIYADELLFYTQKLSQAECISLKKKLFQENPKFEQQIISPVKLQPFTSGVIKCDFTKTVTTASGKKSYPSYLLISYENGEYRVVGESDYQTDRNLRYRPKIGEPIEFSTGPTRPKRDSLSTNIVLADTHAIADSQIPPLKKDTFEVSGQLIAVSTDEGLLIPRNIIWIAAGLFLILVVAVIMRKVKRKGGVREAHTRPRRETDKLEQQSFFRDFVTNLFDPHYFQYRYPSQVDATADQLPDMILTFQNKEFRFSFALICHHVPEFAGEIKLIPRDKIDSVMVFCYQNNFPLYAVVGLGADPSDPREIFLVPESELREKMTYPELKPFRKWGMFFVQERNKVLK